jgi:hypothetical protein
MKYLSAIQSVFTIALLATLPVLAQPLPADSAALLNLDSLPAQSPNRLGLSYRMGFNVPVSFKNLGGFPALSSARYTPDGDRYNYDNGYVLVDSSGNAMGLTRYWGYDNANQVSSSGTISMQRSSSSATASSNDHYDDPMSGVELTYDRELIRKESWRGGLEGAFGYTYMSVRDSGIQSASVTTVNDVYSIPGGVSVVPPPGYTGRKSLPGPVIDASPSGTSINLQQEGLIIGDRDFSADIFSFRFGPYVEIPLSKSITFTLSGGLALMYVDSDFSYSEGVIIPSVGATPHSGSGWSSAWIAGGYVAGSFSVALSESWALVAGAQFEDLGRYTQNVNGKEATLDLSNSVFATVGLTYSF